MDFNETTEQTVQPSGEVPAPSGPEKKKKSGLAIAGIVLSAVLVIAIAVSVAVYAGLFTGKSGKVAKAFINTFREQPLFVQDLQDMPEIAADGQYTMALELDDGQIDIGMDFRVDGLQKQFAGYVGSGAVNLDFAGELTEDEFALSIPAIGNYKFCYNYREIGSGILLEELSEEEIRAVNKLLELSYDPGSISDEDSDKSGAQWIETVADELKERKFEDAETEIFEIDGKEVKCSGYQTTLKQEELTEALDLMEEEYYARNKELIEILYEIDPYYEAPFEEYFDELRMLIEELSDMELKFYIYDKQLAAIVLETQEDGQLRLRFEGGDRRAQNVVLELFEDYEGGVTGTTELISIRGNMTDSTETISLELENMNAFVFTYDSVTGEYELDVTDQTLVLAGEITSDRTGIYITIDECSEYGEELFVGGSLSIKRGAEMEEIEGERFDLGNADEYEWDVMLDNVINALQGF